MGLFEMLFGNTDKKVNDENTISKRIDLSDDVKTSLNSKFISFDVETSGLNPSFDRIIELGAVLFKNGKEIGRFDTLVNAGVEVSPSATRVNHITNEMLKDAPSEEVAFAKFVEFAKEAINGDIYMCAHNGSFDFNFLSNTFKRLHIPLNVSFVDTLTESRRYIKNLENYQQDTVAKYFDLYNENSHRAASDAYICGQILLHLINDDSVEFKTPTKTITASEWVYDVPELHDEEKEICAVVQNLLYKNNLDLDYLSFTRNGSGYLECNCYYTFLQIKMSKKGNYAIIPSEIAKDWKGTLDNCSVHEDREHNIRAYFYNPKELESLEKYIVDTYINKIKYVKESCNLSSSFKDDCDNRLKQFTRISFEEMNNYLDSISNKDYLKKEIKQVEVTENSKVNVKIVNQDEVKCERGRRVLQKDDDGNIINKFETVTEASKTIGVSTKCIRDAAQGKQKHAGGYCWEYFDDHLDTNTNLN